MMRTGNLWPSIVSFQNLRCSSCGCGRKTTATRRGRVQPESRMGIAEAAERTQQRQLPAGALSNVHGERPKAASHFGCAFQGPRSASCADSRRRTDFRKALLEGFIRLPEGLRDASGARTGKGRRTAISLCAEVRCSQVFRVDRPPDFERPPSTKVSVTAGANEVASDLIYEMRLATGDVRSSSRTRRSS